MSEADEFAARWVDRCSNTGWGCSYIGKLPAKQRCDCGRTFCEKCFLDSGIERCMICRQHSNYGKLGSTDSEKNEIVLSRSSTVWIGGGGDNVRLWIRHNISSPYQWRSVPGASSRKVIFDSIDDADKFAEQWVGSCWMNVYSSSSYSDGCANLISSVQNRCRCGRTFCGFHHQNPSEADCPVCRRLIEIILMSDSNPSQD